jgi:recombination protein U
LIEPTQEEMAAESADWVATLPAPKQPSTGDALETLVKKSLKHFEKYGLSVKQYGVQVKGRHGRGGKFQGRTMGKAGLDFDGDYLGRRVTFDAKSTAKMALPLSMLRDHQVKAVRQAHERGAIAFFFVEFSAVKGGPQYFALTWPVLEQYIDGHTAIHWESMSARCVKVKHAGKVLDVLGTVKVLAVSREVAL